jgi:hypothetical protein
MVIVHLVFLTLVYYVGIRWCGSFFDKTLKQSI